MTNRSALWRGSAALVGGRLAMSAGRLLAAVLVARLAGVSQLGAFTLLLSLIAMFEWIGDFGQTDITIRELAKQPDAAGTLVARLWQLKKLTAASVLVLMPASALVAGAAPDLVPAAAIAAIGIGAMALAQPDRVLVRSELRPWLDVAAELGSFSIFLLLVGAAALFSARLPALALAYAIFRITYFCVLHRIARSFRTRLPASDGPKPAIALAAFPLGIAGLLVAVYDNLAPLLLSHVGELRNVGEFAAAARFAFPVIMVVQAITTAVFPALSGEHARSAGSARALQQGALEGALVCAGLLFAGLHGAAGFLVRIVSHEASDAAELLRLLAWLVLARAVTTAMSPLVIVGGRQSLGLLLTAASLVLQIAGIFVLVPRMGILGVGWAYILVELSLGVVPVSLLGIWATGMRLNWLRPLAIVGAAAGAAAAVAATPIDQTLAGGIFAALLFSSVIAIALLFDRPVRLSLFAMLRRAGPSA